MLLIRLMLKNWAGRVTPQAEHDINIGAVTQTTDYDEAIGSTLSGNTVNAQAGNNFNRTNSRLIAQNQQSKT